MASKNVQIKVKQDADYIDVYPKTKITLVEGLNEELATKVTKELGKGLSTNDYTTDEKAKLTGIDIGANNYTHPSTHPASVITQDTNNRFVSDTEKATWNAKQSALGFTPENISNKNKANGYAGLDTNSKIPIALLPDLAKSQTFVVLNATERLAITGMLKGDKVYETSTGDSYIYEGSKWLVLSKADWENVNLQWGNIVGKPTSISAMIDEAVSKRHDHTNKGVLDKITGLTTSSYDLEKFVTKSELGSAGYGDMLKSVYDTNGNGIVDNAEKVNGFTVGCNVPANAKFTDTIYTHPSSHPASIITQDINNRFVSDTEKASWNGKTKISIGTIQPSDADIWLQEV